MNENFNLKNIEKIEENFLTIICYVIICNKLKYYDETIDIITNTIKIFEGNQI